MKHRDESRSTCSCWKPKYPRVKYANPQCVRGPPVTSQKTVAKRPYLGNVVLQLVVLFNIEACPFHPLVKEQQILSVPGIWVNVLLQVTDRHGRRDETVYQISYGAKVLQSQFKTDLLFR